MGLLDALSNFSSTDEGMGLAQGLLSARGSAGLAAGMAGMQSAQENAMKRKFMDMQMKNYASEIAQREEAIKKQQQVSEMVRSFLGGGSASPGLSSPGAYGTPAVDGVGPVVPGAAPRQPGLAGRSVDEIAALHAVGGPNLMDAYKWAREPQQLVGGSVYQNRNTGETEYIPKMPDGMGMDRNGAKPIAGYLQGLAAIEGAKANAAEGAKAGFDLVDVPMGNGQTQKMPRSEAVRLLGGAAPTNSVIPSVGAFQPTSEQLAAIQADANANGIANPFVNFSQKPTGALGRTQSPAEITAQEADRAKAVKQAEADIQPTDKRQSFISSGNYLQAVINQALNHPGRETATGLSGTIDPRNYIPGTHAKDFHALLDQIKGSAFLQAFENLKGGGQITEIEGKKGTDALARLSTAQSDKAFFDALNEFNGIVSSGLERAKSGAVRAGTAPSFSGDNAPTGQKASEIPALPANPSASSLVKGQSYMLPNGKVGKWNGMTFKVE